jgi:hypothetical protein
MVDGRRATKAETAANVTSRGCDRLFMCALLEVDLFPKRTTPPAATNSLPLYP